MSEEKNDRRKCLANGVVCQKCYPGPDAPGFSEEKKRTISLECYLKMQAMLLSSDSIKMKVGDASYAKDAVDALLKNNDVVVEE